MNKRFVLGMAFGLLLTATAAFAITTPIGVSEVEGILVAHDEAISDLQDRVTELEAGTTTTTLPPTTTTTTQPPTTTTSTTTTIPTTTTTSPPLPTPSGPKFDIFLGAQVDGVNFNMWVAPYHRSLPYSTPAGWVDGDRVGYSCAYMFLQREGVNVGRVTFTRAAGYGFVNDKSMAEGVRYFDGAVSTTGQAQLNDCPAPTQAYAPGDGVDYRPLVFYVDDNGLLENRSYTNTTSDAIASGQVRFAELERITTPFLAQGANTSRPATTVYERVTVAAYVQIDGLWQPTMIVYYDTLVPDVHLTEAP